MDTSTAAMHLTWLNVMMIRVAGDLMRASIACPGNDFRLGACEVPRAFRYRLLPSFDTYALESLDFHWFRHLLFPWFILLRIDLLSLLASYVLVVFSCFPKFSLPTGAPRDHVDLHRPFAHPVPRRLPQWSPLPCTPLPSRLHPLASCLAPPPSSTLGPPWGKGKALPGLPHHFLEKRGVAREPCARNLETNIENQKSKTRIPDPRIPHNRHSDRVQPEKRNPKAEALNAGKATEYKPVKKMIQTGVDIVADFEVPTLHPPKLTPSTVDPELLDVMSNLTKHVWIFKDCKYPAGTSPLPLPYGGYKPPKPL